MTESLSPRQDCERWLQVTTGKVHRVVFESQGVCDLEPITGPVLRVKRDVLNTSEAWQKVQ